MKTALATFFVVTALVGTAHASWQQRGIFNPDGLTSHSWTTTTYSLPECGGSSIILQKAKAPGTAVQLLYNPSTNTTCQSAIDKYLEKMINENPAAGSVDFR